MKDLHSPPGLVLKRHGYTFTFTGTAEECRAVLARMTAQGWAPVAKSWGAAVLAAGPL
jgi:hypothetical protein